MMDSFRNCQIGGDGETNDNEDDDINFVLEFFPKNTFLRKVFDCSRIKLKLQIKREEKGNPNLNKRNDFRPTNN